MILPLLLLVLGFGLVACEVFFPSFGVLSVLAGASVLAAIVLGFQHSAPLGWTVLGVAVVGIPMFLILAFRVFPTSPLGRRMVAQGPAWKKEERAAVEHAAQRFVGQEGWADSPLRPAGIASFAGERVDVITRGEHLESGTRVRALRFVGNRLVVEAVDSHKESHS